MFLTEYLYEKYKMQILRYQFPLYIIQLVVFYTSMGVNEQQQRFYRLGIPESTAQKVLFSLMAILNAISTCYNLYLIITNLRSSYQVYFTSPWSFLEVLYFVLNGTFTLGLLSTMIGFKYLSHHNMRIIEAILAIVIVFKLMFYL